MTSQNKLWNLKSDQYMKKYEQTNKRINWAGMASQNKQWKLKSDQYMKKYEQNCWK
jgi:hypothetical protein